MKNVKFILSVQSVLFKFITTSSFHQIDQAILCIALRKAAQFLSSSTNENIRKLHNLHLMGSYHLNITDRVTGKGISTIFQDRL